MAAPVPVDIVNLNGSTSFDINQQQHLKLAAGYETEDGYNVHQVEGVNDGDEHMVSRVMPCWITRIS